MPTPKQKTMAKLVKRLNVKRTFIFVSPHSSSRFSVYFKRWQSLAMKMI